MTDVTNAPSDGEEMVTVGTVTSTVKVTDDVLRLLIWSKARMSIVCEPSATPLNTVVAVMALTDHAPPSMRY